MRGSFLAVAVWAAGCAKCGPPAVVDAGVDAGSAVTAQGERRSIELRTAIVQMFPEYRDVAVLSTRAKVTRVIPGLSDAQRDASLARLGWRRRADGGPGWGLNRFHLEQVAPDALEISLPVDIEALGLLFLAPSSISSMDLANYLPRDLPVGSERFEFEVRYATAPERAITRVRQAVTLLQANGQWRLTRSPEGWAPPDAGAPDGGAALPDDFSVEVRSVDDATIRWERRRGQVEVTYDWLIIAP